MQDLRQEVRKQEDEARRDGAREEGVDMEQALVRVEEPAQVARGVDMRGVEIARREVEHEQGEEGERDQQDARGFSARRGHAARGETRPTGGHCRIARPARAIGQTARRCTLQSRGGGACAGDAVESAAERVAEWRVRAR